MDNRQNRIIALLLVVGGLLVLVGVAVLLPSPPEVPNVDLDGLNGSFLTYSELPDDPEHPTRDRLVGGALTFVGSTAALVGAVAAGVRLALADRGDREA